jgi:hypothetical protein
VSIQQSSSVRQSMADGAGAEAGALFRLVSTSVQAESMHRAVIPSRAGSIHAGQAGLVPRAGTHSTRPQISRSAASYERVMALGARQAQVGQHPGKVEITQSASLRQTSEGAASLASEGLDAAAGAETVDASSAVLAALGARGCAGPGSFLQAAPSAKRETMKSRSKRSILEK